MSETVEVKRTASNPEGDEWVARLAPSFHHPACRHNDEEAMGHLDSLYHECEGRAAWSLRVLRGLRVEDRMAAMGMVPDTSQDYEGAWVEPYRPRS